LIPPSGKVKVFSFGFLTQIHRSYRPCKSYSSKTMILLDLLPALLIALLLFLLGLGVGRLVLRRWRERFESSLAFHAVAGGIGMGLLAHATLVLGLPRLWRVEGFAAAGALAALAAVAGWRPIARRETTGDRPPPEPFTPLQLLAAALLAFLVLALALPTALPPANYDVLEYHLGAVQHWIDRGGIVPFPHLFYSALPFEIEMLYAAGAFLEGNPFLPAVPKFVNLGLFLATLATFHALVALLVRGRTVRLLACLLFVVHPLTAITTSDALNDMGLTWYATLALLAWVLWLRHGARLFFILWGVFLALTVCCKYTAVGLIVLPVAACLLPVGILAERPPGGTVFEGPRLRWSGLQGLGRLAAHALLLGAIVAAVFAPWMLKNTLHHGNPVYPLLSSLFPSPTWTPEQTAFYLEAHGRTSPLAAAYWTALGRNLLRLSPWVLAAAIAGAFIGRSGIGSQPVQSGAGWQPARAGYQPVPLALIASAALGLAVHSVFPGNPARFMLPLYPAALAAAALALERALRPGSALRAAAVAPFILWIGLAVLAAIDPTWLAPRPPDPTRRTPAQAFAAIGFPVFHEGAPFRALVAHLFSDTPRVLTYADALGPPVVKSQAFINDQTPPGAAVFLLYEARIGGFRRPVAVGSVFDRSPLLERAIGAQSGEELLERLRREGFDYLYVNEFELRRLIATYAPRPLFRERVARLGPPDPAATSAWLDLYPPFLLDARYGAAAGVIGEFLALCRSRAVYATTPGRPYGIWIARLR